jgi:hypothetical protein
MTSPNLDNLVGTGQLKREPPNAKKFAGLVRSARARLHDARNESLSLESRFDLAYNAAHAPGLAALRWHGYRSDTRFIVFQCLPHTLGVGPEVWRVLSHCHNLRNRGEYEGFLDLNHRIVVDLVQAAGVLLQEVDNLGPVA